MKKYVACGVLSTPRHRIPMHRVLGVFDTWEQAEEHIVSPTNQLYLEFYIQEVDPSTGLVILPGDGWNLVREVSNAQAAPKI